MQVVRTNNTIYWLATILAATACAMPSPRLALTVAAVSVAIVAAGAVIRYVPRNGSAAQSVWHSLPPMLALLFALYAGVRALM